MREIGIFTLLLIVANGLFTYSGLKDNRFFNKFLFNTKQILVYKDYKRLITSGFLHADWNHFLFNMITLYFFSPNLESFIGVSGLLVLYFVSLIGGNLFTLYIHRNHSNYNAIGASGAVSGLVFASIGLFPGMEIGFILLPVYIPAWIYGIAYVLYSIYGIKTQKDNIGHEAHLGGGIVGLLVSIGLKPTILITNYLPIILILIPSLIFLYLILKKPHLIFIQKSFSASKKNFTIDDKYNSDKKAK
jgi:membrane associated rhomboid family serine protease